jgi:hypothetical protein
MYIVKKELPVDRAIRRARNRGLARVELKPRRPTFHELLVRLKSMALGKK